MRVYSLIFYFRNIIIKMYKEFQVLPEKKFQDRKCQLCYDHSLQTLYLLKSLVQNLKKHLAKYLTQQKTVDSEKTSAPRECANSCQRLFSMVFDSHLKHSSAYRKCFHKQIQSKLKNDLRIQMTVFDEVCDKMTFEIGQRNFHLETLAFQIKTLPIIIHEAITQQTKMRKYTLSKKSQQSRDFTEEKIEEKQSIHMENNDVKMEQQQENCMKTQHFYREIDRNNGYMPMMSFYFMGQRR